VSISNSLVKIAKPVIEKFPRLAATYRLMRDSRFNPEDAKMTPLGFKFSGNEAMERGLHEPEEVEIVKKYLNSCDVFINIGANLGYYCCIALQQGVKTVAFEPIDMNLKYLYANVKANNWEDNIEVFPVALSSKSGLIEIYGGGTGASLIQGWAETPKEIRRLVPVLSLDDVLGERFSGKRCFFLVDIEGAEKFMLEGAIKHLGMKPKPVWMIEICISEHQPQGTKINPHLLSTFQTFWKEGYEARTANQDFAIVTEEEISKIIESGNDTLHTHNFLFISKQG